MNRMVWMILPVLGIAALGCSQAARDRMMHFFFEIPPAETPTAGQAADQGESVAKPEKLQLPPSQFQSVHSPFAQRACLKCHDQQRRMLVREDARKQCEACHPRYFSDEVKHDAVSGGACADCHLPHRSVQLHLLKMPVYETCIECHDEDDVSGAHEDQDIKNCSTCHDAHFG
jgi:predicted CXXCH cytochrome family protein